MSEIRVSLTLSANNMAMPKKRRNILDINCETDWEKRNWRAWTSPDTLAMTYPVCFFLKNERGKRKRWSNKVVWRLKVNSCWNLNITYRCIIPIIPIVMPRTSIASTRRFMDSRKCLIVGMSVSRLMELKRRSTFWKPCFMITKSIATLLLRGSKDWRAIVIAFNMRLRAPSFQTDLINLKKKGMSWYLKRVFSGSGFFRISCKYSFIRLIVLVIYIVCCVTSNLWYWNSVVLIINDLAWYYRSSYVWVQHYNNSMFQSKVIIMFISL